MDIAKQIEYYTIDDIYNLPDGQRAELIDGELYMMSASSRRHQKIISRFNQIIANYIDSNNGDCEVYPCPFAVFLNANDEIYLEPDISVVCDRNKLTKKGRNGAPDWIVDIEKNRIMVYNFEHGTVGEYSFMDKVKAGIYEYLEIDFSGIDME